MKEQWIVAIISTDYDLHDERNFIISYLEENGLKPSAFELPDYPEIPDMHSHDNCLAALQRADIVIVMINERYGGKYYLNNEVSITEQEYDAIKVPKLVLVNKTTWDERNIYRKQKGTNQSEEKTDKNGAYKTVNVQNENVFLFLDKIQADYERTGRSNWMNFWTDLEDLKSKLPKLLQSQSGEIIHRILRKQIEEVKSRRTSTGLSLSLGDVFERGYYIEQDYSEESGKFSEGSELSRKINEALDNDKSCRILGEAGAGKTTLMAKCFLERTEKDHDKYFEIPVYVWLKEYNVNSQFSISEYLEKGCEKHLRKRLYPFMDTAGYKYTFFLDGFDELAENLTNQDMEKVLRSQMFEYPIVLTSRVQYAERYLSGNDISSKFSNSIRLEDWTEETARNYIDRFCAGERKSEKLKEQIHQLLTNNPDLHDVLKKPLLITVLMYVIEHSRMRIPETVNSRTTLFKKCIEILAKRELESKYQNIEQVPDVDEIILCWSYFAWCIYEARLNGSEPITISHAEEKMKKYLEGIELHQNPLTIFEAIFDMDDEFAVGAFHEQFLEYLVAFALVYACKYKSKPYPEFLKYVLKPEVNRYFRTLLESESSEDKERIIKNITDLYYQCAGLEDANDVSIRVHAVYHLTRFDFPERKELIQRLFNIEKDKAVLQSLYFGAIKAGDMCREKEFYEILKTDEGYQDANKGYHLAYYDNLKRKAVLPYTDDIMQNWPGTLHAFRRHFLSKDEEHYRLRRIDLLTMRQLMEFRNSTGPMTDEIMQELENEASQMKTDSKMNTQENEEFYKGVITEFEEVKKLFIRLKAVKGKRFS